MTDNRLILLVEDDVLIGMMLVDMFEALGFPEPAQAAAVPDALAIIEARPVAAALIDINLGETKGWPVADALAQRGIPFAFTSGGGDIIPPAHAHRKLVSKPFRLSEIEAVLNDFFKE
ncbi:response regulator [Sphingopyxis flava]|uniref:Response regulator receiver domain-containing protein n=1 Tax=Sphingopyxis flava TaxID=1507287 RepID=A0A1T4ZU90_9SPHN|nr:response regulator [Sphingopyxis flava]SKB26322.1 Response regulator receiver domain-containing protein [Sphingopyxis flava]